MSKFLDATKAMTPGPWGITKSPYTRLVFVGDGHRHNYPLYKASPDGTGNNQDAANAVALAAAPELREAYELIQATVDYDSDCPPEPDTWAGELYAKAVAFLDRLDEIAEKAGA